MKITSTRLAEVLIIEPRVHADERGFLVELFSRERLRDAGITVDFVQANHSHSGAGVLRGLHYQKAPAGQAKLVRVLRGRVLDVSVDLRRDSPTFAQWVGVELSATNNRSLLVPVGFAHGFFAFEDTDLIYSCSSPYRPEHEGGVIWNDPAIGIEWPLAVGGARSLPRLSPRDAALPALAQIAASDLA